MLARAERSADRLQRGYSVARLRRRWSSTGTRPTRSSEARSSSPSWNGPSVAEGLIVATYRLEEEPEEEPVQSALEHQQHDRPVAQCRVTERTGTPRPRSCFMRPRKSSWSALQGGTAHYTSAIRNGLRPPAEDL
jgi:hypothetical protein